VGKGSPVSQGRRDSSCDPMTAVLCDSHEDCILVCEKARRDNEPWLGPLSRVYLYSIHLFGLKVTHSWEVFLHIASGNGAFVP
jgi:hypothetical protein